MLNENEYRQPIIKMGTRILRPKEFRAILDCCHKIEYQTMFQALMFTGMRYIEMQRFQKNPKWFDGDFIHLPKEAVHKQERTQLERWVRLNNIGKMSVKYFLDLAKKDKAYQLPSYQSWQMNLKRWAGNAGLDTKGLTVKTTRKTWESWLMYYYPTRIMDITMSQGHTQTISIQHYVTVPFTEVDKIEMKSYVEGWV